MNKYQIALNEISSAVLDVYADGYNQPRTAQECYCSSFETLQELVDKADPLEWIPFPPKDEVTVCLDCLVPEVDEEILVSDGEDVWQDRWLIISKGYDYDYELDSEIDFEGLAWMPLPKPYKEQENE